MLSPGCSRLRGLARGPPSELTPAVRSRPGAAPPILPRGSARTGRTLGAGAGPPCSASWAHQRPPRRLRARARALASRSWRRDLRSGRAPGGSRAAVPTGLPRFGGLSDEPPRPEMFRLERHFPEGSGHSRSSASIPCSRGSPSLQAAWLQEGSRTLSPKGRFPARGHRGSDVILTAATTVGL
ncbi:uncharacterized protein [Equus asinus]|uniref:uncharacterized protein isoform X4 n=1 Tax=Equus asinus TaxID=9793 RepID=UPI0038F7D374